MPRVNFVKAARKPIKDAGIKIGDSYYWWKFRYGGKHVSKTPPRRSQLTQSGFLSTLWDIEDRIGEFTCDDADEFESFKSDIVSEISDLRDETENSLSNMPDSLQYGPTGELLQERIDALESWESEIDGIECDVDVDSIRSDVEGEFEKEEEESDDDYRERIDEEVAVRIQEIIDEAISELQNTSSNL